MSKTEPLSVIGKHNPRGLDSLEEGFYSDGTPLTPVYVEQSGSDWYATRPSGSRVPVYEGSRPTGSPLAINVTRLHPINDQTREKLIRELRQGLDFFESR